jgi:uncharacterized protein with von Willebrand factor type A (vWA) domain
LRLRERLPLAGPDYLLARQALACGFGGPSRDDLRLVCETLWAKSPSEQALVARVLEECLPPRWRQEQAIPDEPPGEPEETNPPSPPNEIAPPSAFPPTSSEPSLAQGFFRPAHAGATDGIPIPSAAAVVEARVSARQSRVPFDLVGELPVGRRHMQRAWRYYRRLRRDGPPVELEIAATVESIHRCGLFLGAVLIPRRRNLARLLLLIDTGGSMVPFEREVAPMLDTAREAGLVRVEAAYFHDVPGPSLFHDRALTHPVADFTAFMEPFIAAGILIVSDAGAARNRCDDSRVASVACELDRLRTITPSIAWVNPTPADRWIETTAGGVAHHVAMFPLNRAGLDHAVEVLRGRLH